MIEIFYRNSEVSQKDHGGSRKFHADILAPSCGKIWSRILWPWNHLRGEPNLLHLMRVRILSAIAPPRGVSKVSHLYGSRIFATARHPGGCQKFRTYKHRKFRVCSKNLKVNNFKSASNQKGLRFSHSPFVVITHAPSLRSVHAVG